MPDTLKKIHTLESLKNPPIVEVACGIYFEDIPAIDPIWVGTYWNSRRDEFPTKSIQTAIVAEPILTAGVPPLRSWLISKDSSFLIQIQQNRFYLNWRKVGNNYPLFNGKTHSNQEILPKVIQEFELFSNFCKQSIGTTPIINGVELAKVNFLVKNHHWTDLKDLREVLPWVEPFVSFSTSSEPSLSVHFNEQREQRTVDVSISSGKDTEHGNINIIRIEIKITFLTKLTDVKAEFINMNLQANDVFCSLIPEEQRNKRFV